MIDQQLIGYVNNKVYTSKNTALKTCGKIAQCKGVTKEGPRRYRLNTSTTHKTVKGRKIWIQGSRTETLEDYEWTPKSNWVLTGHETGRFNNKRQAARACAKWQYCNGYIKHADNHWSMVSGAGFKYKKGVVSYIRGGHSFSSYSIFHEGELLSQGCFKLKICFIF